MLFRYFILSPYLSLLFLRLLLGKAGFNYDTTFGYGGMMGRDSAGGSGEFCDFKSLKIMDII